MKSTLAAWVLAAIESLAPSSRQPYREPVEAPAERHARYERLADAIAVAVADLPDDLLPHKGPEGQRKMAALATAIAHHESGFLLGVRRGVRRGDGGRSWCEFQVNIGRGKTVEGWTGPELSADVQKCATAGVRILARSLGACRGLPPLDRLSAYASGKCQVGVPASRAMMSAAVRLLRLPMPARAGERAEGQPEATAAR